MSVNYKLPLSFSNKTVYHELLVLHRVLFENMYVLNKNKNIINAGYWVLSENYKN